MSRLVDMIDLLCPDGVEYRKLGDVLEIGKGVQFNKNDMEKEGSYPVINGGITPSGYIEQYNQEENTITISQGGASAGFVNWIETKFWAGAHCYVISPNESLILNRFVYHFLKFSEYKLRECQYGAGIPALSKSTITALEIPVPPLVIQEEIVRILDKYIVIVSELEKELVAELDCRKKQYDFYKTKLLNFDNRKDIEIVTLGELSELVTKQTGFDYSKTIKPSLLKSKESGSLPYLQTKFFNGKNFNYNTDYYVPNSIANLFPKIVLNKQCLLFSIVGASIGNVGLFPGTETCFLGGAICVLKFKDRVNVPYIYELMSSIYGQKIIRKKIKGLGQATITVEDIRNFQIPMCKLKEQQYIVSFLNRFDTLSTELQSGLSAEITDRRKQYEYYREKLLTFKRKIA